MMEIEPEQKAMTRLTFDDEDSGLGMDFEEYSSNSGQDEIVELSPLTSQDLFYASDDSGSCDVLDIFERSDKDCSPDLSAKRQRYEEPCETDSLFKRPKCMFGPKKWTKSLSFGDQPRCCGPNDVDVSINRVLEHDDLIADGTSPYRLPTVKGKHSDLKSITPETMRDILVGQHNISYRVIDCRYPFEYEGGHIQGALNLHTKDKIIEFLNTETTNRPDILIFHCEFSSERGPKLCRFLRNNDRQINGERYPSLYYPEVYVLHGGYKDFYQSFKELCFPRNYIPMLHEDYTQQVCHFRSKSKSWAGGEKRRNAQRLFL